VSDIGPGSEENRTSNTSQAGQPAPPQRDKETNQWALSGNTLGRLSKYSNKQQHKVI
jgi:hypothetical protein